MRTYEPSDIHEGTHRLIVDIDVLRLMTELGPAKYEHLIPNVLSVYCRRGMNPKNICVNLALEILEKKHEVTVKAFSEARESEETSAE